MRKGALWLVLLGILAMGLVVGPDMWAAPEQNPARQTVPTRTPPSPPSPPTRTPPSPPTQTPPSLPTSSSPADQPTSAPTAAMGAIPAGRLSKPLLPEAGGWDNHLFLGVALMVIGFLVLVVVRRRA